MVFALEVVMLKLAQDGHTVTDFLADLSRRHQLSCEVPADLRDSLRDVVALPAPTKHFDISRFRNVHARSISELLLTASRLLHASERPWLALDSNVKDGSSVFRGTAWSRLLELIPTAASLTLLCNCWLFQRLATTNGAVGERVRYVQLSGPTLTVVRSRRFPKMPGLQPRTSANPLMERVMKQNHHSRRKRRGPRGGHLDTTRTRDPSCLLSQPLAGSPTTTLVGRTLYTSSGFRRKLKLDSFPLETSVDSLLQRVFVSSPVSCGCLMCLFLRDCCERLRENVAGVDRLTPSLCLTCPATAMGRHIAAAEVSVTGRPHSKHPCPFDFSPEESGQVVSSLVFQELTVPRSQMCEFLLLAADAIAPAGLRSLLSRRKWRRYICDIVLLHKGEVITMHSLLQGIAIGPLLSSFDVEPTQALQARLCLLLARMFAFVGSSVCSLVKASFVAMDSETEGHRLLFFRKIVAQRLIKHLTNSLTINHEPVAACKYQPLLRWTAKRTGARPLVDCAARNSGRLFAGLAEGDILEGAATIAQRRMSINAATAPILRRLTAWMECYPHGISVMGFNHVLLRLRAYIQALDLSNRRPLRFYVAVADLSGCFNELRISDLNTRLKQHLSRSTLDTALRSSLFFCTLFRDRGGPNAFRIAKLAMRSFHGLDCHVPSVLDDSLNWLDTRQRNQLREAPKVKLLSVVVPSTLLYLGNLTSDVTSFLRLLDERYSFRVDGLAFRPTLGIPQGLAASPRFCALYYDSIDRETDAANRMGKALALRWVDDFLVVSTERADVEAFLHMLLEERSWGNNVKEEKVKTNFDYQSPNHTFTGESRLQWCGIDVELPNEQWQELAGVDSSPPSRGRKRQLPVRERPPKRGCCTGNVRLDLGLPATKYGSCPIRGLLCLQPTFRHRKRIATGDTTTYVHTFEGAMYVKLWAYANIKLRHGLFTCSEVNSALQVARNVAVLVRVAMMRLVLAVKLQRRNLLITNTLPDPVRTRDLVAKLLKRLISNLVLPHVTIDKDHCVSRPFDFTRTCLMLTAALSAREVLAARQDPALALAKCYLRRITEKWAEERQTSAKELLALLQPTFFPRTYRTIQR